MPTPSFSRAIGENEQHRGLSVRTNPAGVQPSVCGAGNWKLRSATPTMVNGSRRQAARWVPSPREEFRITVRPMTSGEAAERAAPEALADDQRRRGVVRAVEPPAQPQLSAHRREERVGDRCELDGFGPPVRRHHALIGRVERDGFECATRRTMSRSFSGK